MNLSVAISVASQAFENKFDKGGKPYILHCLWVMNKVKHLGETAMICAVLHDVIEDCGEKYSSESLLKLGFSKEIIRILKLLTHNKEVDAYMTYIKSISDDPLATKIKLADLEHNSSITRLKGVKEKDVERIKQYHLAYTFLVKEVI